MEAIKIIVYAVIIILSIAAVKTLISNATRANPVYWGSKPPAPSPRLAH
jgi:hypothetical protein